LEIFIKDLLLVLDYMCGLTGHTIQANLSITKQVIKIVNTNVQIFSIEVPFRKTNSTELEARKEIVITSSESTKIIKESQVN
jgi:hypothetical protein